MTPPWCTKVLVLLVGSGLAGFDALAGVSFLGLTCFSLGCLAGGLTAGGFLLGDFMTSFDFLFSVPWNHTVLNYKADLVHLCVCHCVGEYGLPALYCQTRRLSATAGVPGWRSLS